MSTLTTQPNGFPDSRFSRWCTAIVLLGNAVVLVVLLAKVFQRLLVNQQILIVVAAAMTMGTFIAYIQNWLGKVPTNKLIWGLVMALIFSTIALESVFIRIR